MPNVNNHSWWFKHLPLMAIPSAIHPYFMGINIFHTPSGVTKFAGKTFSSDLRKLTATCQEVQSIFMHACMYLYTCKYKHTYQYLHILM